MGRIARSDGFSDLLSRRPACRTRRLQCFVSPNRGSGQRLGVLVPKRFALRAIDRHCLKRIIREAHRLWVVPGQLNQDILVRLTAKVTAVGPSDRQQWWEEIRQLFSLLQKP